MAGYDPVQAFHKGKVIDNVSVVGYDSDGNPAKVELYCKGKLVATMYLQYESGNVKNVKTEYASPPLEWWYG